MIQAFRTQIIGPEPEVAAREWSVDELAQISLHLVKHDPRLAMEAAFMLYSPSQASDLRGSLWPGTVDHYSRCNIFSYAINPHLPLDISVETNVSPDMYPYLPQRLLEVTEASISTRLKVAQALQDFFEYARKFEHQHRVVNFEINPRFSL